MKAIINAKIYDFENYIENGYILYDKKILETGKMEDYPGALFEINAKGNLVIPGLVVGHTHIYSTFARGLSVPFNPKNFKDILTQLWWKLDAKLDKEANYYSALVAGLEFLKNGVTTVIDHHASGLQIKGSLSTLKQAICEEIGLRGIFCFETSDRFNVKECVEENVEFAAHSNEMHAGIFGLHASLSLSEETLKVVSQHYEGPIHIHVAESPDDEKDSIEKYGMRVVKRLEKHSLLRENSILAHCVHVNEEEMALISQYKCYVAYNVTSNMNNAVGLPDYQKMKRYGINVIAGNDGLGFNFSRDLLNIFFSMKLAGNSPISFDFNDFIKIINNTYELAGKYLGVKLGKIKPGYAADLLIIPYDIPTPMNSSNIIGHFIFGVLDNFKPSHVIVNGKTLIDNFNVLLQTEIIYKEASKIAETVWKRL
ncbi:amidohydrolase family protein [Thermosipho ferrireducens]|uniref:Amidohydrolase family protein n=1 Tax=Thermosipho ferrireducens TaxID=2571116 RepID=A0ABX7S5C7_9BACT|nr:amidohydrolase family protein [Thermosipho ferrireducens]QTA37729.1 amidohydrolase family protein [Thermosipho ferrireducens]